MKDSARRWWAMAAISVSVLVVSLDLTVLSLALPTIAGTMHASTADLQWITDAYALVIAALILPAGLLGDRYGRKKVLLAALVVFVASSVWCAYAASVGELIAARAVLGVGAAAVFPMAISVIPVMFREEERQKAISVMAASLFLAYPIGPIVGGFLLDHFWWGSVFLINVPIVAIALVAVTFLLPESRAAKRPTPGLPRHRDLERRADRPHVRVHQGGPGRLDRHPGAGDDRRGTGGPRRLRVVGAVHRPAERQPAARRPVAVPGGQLPVGHAADDVRVVRHVRPVLRRCRSTSRTSAARRRSAAGCGCCR